MRPIFGLRLTYKLEGSEDVVSEEFHPGVTLDRMTRNVKGLTSKQRCDLKNRPIEVEHGALRFWLEVIEKGVEDAVIVEEEKKDEPQSG